MKTLLIVSLAVALVVVTLTIAPEFPGAQTCTQTITTAQAGSLPSLVASAANGAVICLDSGNYGTVTLSGITSRTDFVTLRSTTGVGAQMTPNIVNSRFIKIQSMTVQNVSIENCSRSIQILGNTFVQNGRGIMVNHSTVLGSPACPALDHAILIDGNTMIKTRVPFGEGKIMLAAVNGIQISNNLIQGEPDFAVCSSTPQDCGGDAIQSSWGTITNMRIGPGNVFRDITQTGCAYTGNNSIDPHCDVWQAVDDCVSCTIDGNWFDSNTVVMQNHGSNTSGLIFRNNLITDCFQWHQYGDTSGSVDNSIIEHNTIYACGSGAMRWGSNGSIQDQGVIGRSNILINSSNVTVCSGGNGCVYTHNTCNVAANCGFNTANGQNGNPIFIGGTVGTISTYAGYQLASNSPVGLGNAHDGLNRGIVFSGTPTPAAPPVNLRVTQIWAWLIRG
jgi:hypothetical protein